MNRKNQTNWWIRISTRNPDYIYYFGDFSSYWEAKKHKLGYIKDLKEERAEITNIEVKQCQPSKLTIPLNI